MTIRRRRGDAARLATRIGRGLTRGAQAAGPQARYARVLDGQRLWLAVPADAGRPMLWDETADRAVDVVDDLPPDHTEHDPSCRSVRWRLDDVLPEREDAQLLVVVEAADGSRTPVRRPEPPPRSRLRIPPTPDRRWRFALPSEGDGLLRVRRTRAATLAVLDSIQLTGSTVTLACTTPVDVTPQLMFLGKGGAGPARTVPMSVDAGRYVVSLGAADLPPDPGGYRVAVGSPGQSLTVARHHNDLYVHDANDVLLPLLLDPEGVEVLGRFAFNSEGVLRLQRRRSTGGQPVTDLEDEPMDEPMDEPAESTA